MPLDIIIIGAGIAGLSAAVAIAPHGHHIRIFEKAHSFDHEGSGMILIPTANRILHEWHIKESILKPVRSDVLSQRRMDDTSLIAEVDNALKRKELGIEFPPLVVDRADLHASLYDKISGMKNVELSFRAPVVNVDTRRGIVHFKHGSTRADLIIASDGIHSAAYNSFPILSTPEYIAIPQRRAIRFNNCVLDVSDCASDPLVADLLSKMQISRGPTAFVDEVLRKDPRIPTGPKDPFSGTGYLCLPMRDKTLIGVNSFRPEAAADSEEGPWTTTLTPKEYMKDIHGDQLAEALQRALGMGRFCERWTLGIRDCPMTFVQHKTVLVGDAAHPLNPSIGAGSGLAIEDGACLGILLATASRSNLSRRLELYNELRYTRCVALKALSEWTRPPGTGTSEEMFARLCPGVQLPDRKDLLSLEGLYDTTKETREVLTDDRSSGIWRLLRSLVCLQ